MSERTIGRWSYDPARLSIFATFPDMRQLVGRFASGTIDRKDAQYLCLAVNNHERLVEALRLIRTNAKAAREYTLSELNNAKAAQRLVNILDWPGMQAAHKILEELET